jgi:hypothetical protein
MNPYTEELLAAMRQAALEMYTFRCDRCGGRCIQHKDLDRNCGAACGGRLIVEAECIPSDFGQEV